jgi:hypothetical protein
MLSQQALLLALLLGLLGFTLLAPSAGLLTRGDAPGALGSFHGRWISSLNAE